MKIQRRIAPGNVGELALASAAIAGEGEAKAQEAYAWGQVGSSVANLGEQMVIRNDEAESSKALARATLEFASLEDQLSFEAHQQAGDFMSRDVHAGLAAARARREPEFEGR